MKNEMDPYRSPEQLEPQEGEFRGDVERPFFPRVGDKVCIKHPSPSHERPYVTGLVFYIWGCIYEVLVYNKKSRYCFINELMPVPTTESNAHT